jgi:hypothetical protein
MYDEDTALPKAWAKRRPAAWKEGRSFVADGGGLEGEKVDDDPFGGGVTVAVVMAEQGGAQGVGIVLAMTSLILEVSAVVVVPGLDVALAVMSIVDHSALLPAPKSPSGTMRDLTA